jgi:hypothetical protein
MNTNYQCVGSMDRGAVNRAFDMMLPVWEFLDAPECSKIQASRAASTNNKSDHAPVMRLRELWPRHDEGFADQSKNFGLPLCVVSMSEVVNWIRSLEQIICDNKLDPVMAYWSSNDCSWILPDQENLKELAAQSRCLSIFSEFRDDKPSEMALLVECAALCLSLYCRQQPEC